MWMTPLYLVCLNTESLVLLFLYKTCQISLTKKFRLFGRAILKRSQETILVPIATAKAAIIVAH